MTTTVFLVRHGTHGVLGRMLCGRIPALALAPDGRREAAAVGRRLSEHAPRALYASPLQRAQETAAIIGDATGLVAQTTGALDEIEFGAWTGRDFADLRNDPAWERWNQARSHHRPPGGETMLEVQTRVAAWLSTVMATHPEAAIVAVSHSDVIKALLCHALGLSIDHHHRFEVSPGSISTIVAGTWGMTVHGMNERPA